jgi:hypothetical protein
MKATLAALALAALLTFPAQAAAGPLTKRDAHRHGLRFVAPFVDMLDLERTVTVRMVRPRDCKRLTRATVKCRFHARLADGRTVRSHVRVHRQRDGLIGFRMPLDVLAEATRR